MTMVRSATAIAGAAVSALALVGSGSAAWGATDTTPPVLNLPTSAAFTVGYQVSDTDYASNDMSAYTRVKETLRWDANDPSGICSYDVAHEIAYGTYGWIDGTQATSVSDTIDDYDGTYDCFRVYGASSPR